MGFYVAKSIIKVFIVVEPVVAESLFSVFIVAESIVVIVSVPLLKGPFLRVIVTVFYVKISIVVESIENVHCCEVHCCVVHSYRAIDAESLVASPIVAGSIER